MGIIGLIFSCFFCIPIFAFVGLILCIVALCSKKTKSVCGAVGIGIAIFSILLGILAPQFMKYVDEVKKDSATNTTIETSSVESTEASTSTTIHPGETVETDDLKITFISCGDYETDNSFLTPEEGYKYVIATFEFENIGTSDEFVSCWDFDCYADGYAIEQSYLSDDNLSATISAGKKAKGSVTFEVPTDATEIELEYTVNIWTEEKIIFLLSDN
ncbi:MAG: DUF4352 domain-containing protein [Lachnospiraceae bacterium]|nr:DUF4352 domain-containing protein [Lachnospiraceae bacterium]